MHRPTSLIAGLLATAAAVTAVLCWLGWQVLEQQRRLDEQRTREQLESLADATAARMRGKLAETSEQLGNWLADSTSAPHVSHAVALLVSDDRVVVSPAGAVPFVPVAPGVNGGTDRFREIEIAEFAKRTGSRSVVNCGGRASERRF